jgi:signal transduction histidine kinase
MLLQRLAVLEHQESDSKMKKAQKKALRMQAEEQGRLLREEHMSLAHEEAWTSIVERDLRMFERELAKRRPW